MKARANFTQTQGLLRAKLLAGYPWLVHGFTTRKTGNLSYRVGDTRAAVRRHRQRLLRQLGGNSCRLQLVTLEQVHSDLIVVADQLRRAQHEPDGAVKLNGDAVITHQAGLLLTVEVADCLPILLVDPVERVVANVHAGWRGTLARIAEKTVGQMRFRFGSEPMGLLAVIGPGIHACCYEVGREVFEQYVAQFASAETFFRHVEASPSELHWHPKVTGRPLKPPRGDPAPEVSGRRTFLDLVEANRQQLRAVGLRARNLIVAPFCTACRTDLFFSHRAEAGRTGRQMGLVGIAAEHK